MAESLSARWAVMGGARGPYGGGRLFFRMRGPLKRLGLEGRRFEKAKAFRKAKRPLAL
jgi:hypothetical protein